MTGIKSTPTEKDVDPGEPSYFDLSHMEWHKNLDT